MRVTPLLLALIALPAVAAGFSAQAGDTLPKPEIDRPEATPQAVGAAHTLRTIPEACARIQGKFTGRPAEPYDFAVVRTSPRCQQRARLVDAATVKPSKEGGWIFNDLIRVPSAACPTQKAVVKIWRKPAGSAEPTLDATGAARIYLGDAKKAAAAGQIAAVPTFAAAMSVEGQGCGG